MTLKGKEIDFKSMVIGFLLAMVMMLLMGAGPSAPPPMSGPLDVRIVDIETRDSMQVKLEGVDRYSPLAVQIKDQTVKVRVENKVDVDVKNKVEIRR